MFFKIGALENFADFKGKHQGWSRFLKLLQVSKCDFNKVALRKMGGYTLKILHCIYDTFGNIFQH